MFGKATQAQQRPTAIGLMAQASIYGATIPRIYGRMMSPMYMIWAANLREGDSGKKGKKAGKKGAPPTYIENADFILGSNPIIGTARMWQNQQELAINLRQWSGPIPSYIDPNPFIIGPGGGDPNFRHVLGVTCSMPYDVTFNDYGGQGADHLTGTFEVPMWNGALAGPNPNVSAVALYSPFVYYWYPGSGPGITFLDTRTLFWELGVTTITVYYTQVVDAAKGGPLAQLRMEFEPELGSGSEFVGFETQRIRYHSYAGIGSANLDMGMGQMMPNLKAEVLGCYPLYPTGDADFVDMMEDIIRQGVQQGTPYPTVPPDGAIAPADGTSAYTPLQFGLSCFESPGTTQMKFRRANEDFVAPGGIQYDKPVTAGNILLAAVNCSTIGTSFPAIPVITSDSQGNTWTPLFAPAAGYQVWWAKAGASGPLTVNFDAIGNAWSLQLVEVEGVDEVNAVAHSIGTTFPAKLNITTTNAPGTPCYIFGWEGDDLLTFGAPRVFPSPLWKTLIGPLGAKGNAYQQGTVGCFSQYQVVKNPGTYSFSAKDPGGPIHWRLALIALTRSQPSPTPQPFGDIIHEPSFQSVRDQCRAYGLWGSLSMQSQKKASEWLDDLGIASNSVYVWSGFRLKCLPRAEQSFVGNGAIYTAPTASGPVADLRRSQMIGDATNPKISLKRTKPTDRYNIIQIQHPGRQQGRAYAPIITAQPDNASIAKYGIRKAEPKVLDCVPTVPVARTIAGILVRRSTNQPNVWTFTLKAGWKLLECWDLVLITDEFIGLFQKPVRLTSIKEDPDGNLACEAEDFIYGVHTPVALPATDNQSQIPDVNGDPGDVNPPIIFKAQDGMLGLSTSRLVFGLSGANPNWGGCIIWASADGTNYTNVGERVGATTMGVTTDDWPQGATVDASDPLSVDVTESFGVLGNFSNTDEDNFVSLFYVEGGVACIPFELGSYGVADLTGPSAYTIEAGGASYIRRGAYASPITDHPVGSKFALVDQNVTVLPIDPNWIGKTIFFKFTSFNKLGGGLQDRSQVTAYPYTLPPPCISSIPGAAPAIVVDIPATTAPGPFQVAHSLGSVPTLGLLELTSSGNIWFDSIIRYDANFIYLVASGIGQTGKVVLWNAPVGTEIELSSPAPGNFQIAHGLAAPPTMLAIQMTSSGNIWSQPLAADANFLYLVASGAGVTAFTIAWGTSPGGSLSTSIVQVPLNPAGSGDFTIPHGLNIKPLAAFIRMTSGGRIWFQSTLFDDTNLYLTASGVGVSGVAEVIFGIPSPGAGGGGFYINGN